MNRAFILEYHQSAFGEIPELRRRIVAVLCQHCQLLYKPTPRKGIGAFARMLTFEHFALLGLQPHLWSLPRGLGRRLGEYQSATYMNESIGTDGLEGGQTRTERDQLAFIDFMLDVCHEEVDHMSTVLSRHRLRERILDSFKTSKQIASSGVSPKVAPAVLALLIQGSLPEREFKIFTGLRSDEASDEVNRLRSLGIVGTSSDKTQRVEPKLPVWFANVILPDSLARIKGMDYALNTRSASLRVRSVRHPNEANTLNYPSKIL